jgi:hypothetical protein
MPLAKTNIGELMRFKLLKMFRSEVLLNIESS